MQSLEPVYTFHTRTEISILVQQVVKVGRSHLYTVDSWVEDITKLKDLINKTSL